MNRPPKPPRPAVLPPPPSDPRNALIRAHEERRPGTLDNLRMRQSDHEFKTQENFEALKRRDEQLVTMLLELGAGQIVVARELGIEHRLPPAMRNRTSAPPPPVASGTLRPVPPPPAPSPVLPAIRRDSRRGRLGTYGLLALTVAEIFLEFLRHWKGF